MERAQIIYQSLETGEKNLNSTEPELRLRVPNTTHNFLTSFSQSQLTRHISLGSDSMLIFSVYRLEL